MENLSCAQNVQDKKDIVNIKYLVIGFSCFLRFYKALHILFLILSHWHKHPCSAPFYTFSLYCIYLKHFVLSQQ